MTSWTAAHQASLSFTISQSCSVSCPCSQWCYPTISSYVVPFSFCLQSFPASKSFPMSHLCMEKEMATHSSILDGEFHGQSSLAGYSPWGWKELDRDWATNMYISCIRWPKCWSFSFSISPSNQYPGLIPLRIDCFDLAVQETLKSLLQHHSSKGSVLQHSDFLMGQHSHLYTTTRKIIALTVWTFIRKVMSLLFNMLSRFGYSL